MYCVNERFFLNAEENEKLLTGDLNLVKTIYVENKAEVPVEYEYEYGEYDIHVF